ncbi:DUF342 domain-containing protein [Paenibacillus chungangensis]|uniref:DUF342 domain-containing protein n=1 Tax=Paenibacillus chungangensis TaxID=696535 RepID=A0ABW3HPQ0_9BACL
MDNFQLDSYLRVQTSPDKLSAFITFARMTEDFACTPEELGRFLRSKGIVHGLHTEVLEQICLNPLAYCKEQTLIAQGQSPKPGRNGSISFVYDKNADTGALAQDEHGKVDLKQVTKLNNVNRGQLLAELLTPTAGPVGHTVTGEELEPVMGKPAHFKIGKNVVMNGEGTALYAAIDGLVAITEKGKINVFPVYEVNGDVDYSVGNIDFVGTVVIRGNVLSGFKIHATGDIRVVGGVEGAELASNGSIEITGGIMAGGKGSVKAAGDVRCSFIQEGNVIASGNIVVSQSIMHANVKAGGSVICSGAKGLIVGGVIQAGTSVQARMIGNSMSTATFVEVGVNPELRDELQELRQSIKNTYDSLDKTEKALIILNTMAASGQLTPDRLAMRVKLNATKRQANVELGEAKERMLDIEKMLEDTGRSKVDVSGTVYGGTKIVIGRYTKFVKDATQRVSFQYMEGDIAIVPYSP